MSILYREDSRQFHLTNGKISYIFCVLDNGELGHLYFGPAVRDRESFTHWVELPAGTWLCAALPTGRIFP